MLRSCERERVAAFDSGSTRWALAATNPVLFSLDFGLRRMILYSALRRNRLARARRCEERKLLL